MRASVPESPISWPPFLPEAPQPDTMGFDHRHGVTALGERQRRGQPR